MLRRRDAAAAGLIGGLVAGLIVWSQQTYRSRRDLFSAQAWRRVAALGYLSGQPSARHIRLLRDYVRWEKSAALRRRGERILRQMERSLD